MGGGTENSNFEVIKLSNGYAAHMQKISFPTKKSWFKADMSSAHIYHDPIIINISMSLFTKHLRRKASFMCCREDERRRKNKCLTIIRGTCKLTRMGKRFVTLDQKVDNFFYLLTNLYKRCYII
jgi:hypothetical protein